MSEPTKSLSVRSAGWSAANVEQHLDDFHQRRHAKVRQRRALAGGGATLLAAAVALWMLGFSPTALNTRIFAPSGDAQIELPSDSTDGRIVRFRDGSTAEMLTPESQLHVAQVSESSVTVELPKGSARFEVVPNKTRRFVVKARGVVVTVLGTAFDIRHEASRTHVSVVRGRVEVRAPRETRVLRGGEAAWFDAELPSLTDGTEKVVPLKTASPSKKASAAQVTPNASTNGATRDSDAAHSAGASPRQVFLDHHRRAEYKLAYKVLRSNQEALGSSAEDLLKAADAARYAGHPREATRYLTRVPDGSPLATTAAFTLGRLYAYELGAPAQAAEAFARARRLAAGGALAEDALFREIEARARAGQAARARELAHQYLKTYPDSRRRESVVQWGAVK